MYHLFIPHQKSRSIYHSIDMVVNILLLKMILM